MSGARTDADVLTSPAGDGPGADGPVDSVAGEPDYAAGPPETEPAHEDTLVRGLSMAIGGPLGEHAARRTRRWDRMSAPTIIILLLTIFTLGVHWIQKYPCHTGNAWDENWNQYANFCYSDIIPLYHAEGLGEGKVPYRDHPVEYPVLTGAMMGVIGLPVHEYSLTHPEVNAANMYYQLNALVLGAFALVTVAVIMALRRRRPWDAAMFAVAPAMFFTVTVNWDFLAIGLTALFMLAWARKKPVAAGILLGLAAAAKFYPLFIAGPLIVLAIRTGRWRHTLWAVGTGVITWCLVNLPVAYLWPEGWKRFFQLSSERPIDWGTFWFIMTNIPTGQGQKGIEPFLYLGSNIPVLNFVFQALFALGCVGVAALALTARRRPRLAQLAFLVVAIFLLTSKVWSQQFGLWLIPLAVMARPRWVALLIWQMAEVFYFLAFYGWMMNISGRRVYDDWVFTLAATLRWGTLLALVVLVVRDILHPEYDVVRGTYGDDPDGGPFDGAPDTPVFYRRSAARAGAAPPPAPPPPPAGPPEADDRQPVPV